MKKIISALLVLLSTGFLSGCAEMSQQDVGMLAGGVAGGLLGSTVGGGDGRLVAIAAGTLAGAYLGGAIGRDMDKNDRRRLNNALENNDVGEPAYWRNANTGRRYEVVPVRNLPVHGNRYCREYRTYADIAGRRQQIFGTACRKPDGTWQAVR